MRALLSNPWLELATRLVTGTTFIAASIEKAADPATFAILIENYRILSPELSLLVASTLPWVELVCGFAILFGWGVRGGALVLGLLTAGFTAALISGVLRGLDISCGCYTLDPDVGRIGWRKVAEDVALLVLFLFLVYSTGTRYTLEAWLSSRTGKEGAVN